MAARIRSTTTPQHHGRSAGWCRESELGLVSHPNNSLSIASRGARRLGDLPKNCHLLPSTAILHLQNRYSRFNRCIRCPLEGMLESLSLVTGHWSSLPPEAGRGCGRHQMGDAPRSEASAPGLPAVANSAPAAQLLSPTNLILNLARKLPIACIFESIFSCRETERNPD